MEGPGSGRCFPYLKSGMELLKGISKSGILPTECRDVAEKAESGSVILVMLPDTGERYLSTYLFEELEEGSDDAWLESLRK